MLSSSSSEQWAPALSVSRARDFMKCPLKFRLLVVDRIPSPATRATAMGTLVHAVLEHLFDVPQHDRTPEHAQELVAPQWEVLRSNDHTVMNLFDSEEDLQSWMRDVRTVIEQYFHIEDPRWLEPVGREELITVVMPEGIRLRGFIDRIDQAPTGQLRVVDYKTGKAPSPRFQDEALYQMRFYALLLQLTRELPARTQLVYIKSGQVLTLDPTDADMVDIRADVAQLWERIESAARQRRFVPTKNPLCNWCHVQSMCPIFGGQVPDIPEEGIERVLSMRASQ